MEYILYNNQLKIIKKRLSLRMNGVVSGLMQETSNQSINYGLTIPQVKKLAIEFEKEEGLAEALIRQDVREMKLLAFLLYPPEKLNKQKAFELLKMCSEDLIDTSCNFLFCHMKEAENFAIELLTHKDENELLCAYSLGGHLIKTKKLQRINLFLQFHKHLKSKHLYRNILNFCLFAAKNQLYKTQIEAELLKLNDQQTLHRQFKQEITELLIFID